MTFFGVFDSASLSSDTWRAFPEETREHRHASGCPSVQCYQTERKVAYFVDPLCIPATFKAASLYTFGGFQMIRLFPRCALCYSVN